MKQVLVVLEKLDKDKFNTNETVREGFNKDSQVKVKQIMCPKVGINQHELDALHKLNVYYENVSKKVYPKIEEQLALARSNETDAEVNEGNEKSQAAAREREEADTWGSRIKNFVGTVTAIVAGGVATPQSIYMAWMVCKCGIHIRRMNYFCIRRSLHGKPLLGAKTKATSFGGDLKGCFTLCWSKQPARRSSKNEAG